MNNKCVVKTKRSKFDKLSTADRSHRMSLVKSSNTKPELVIRKLAFSLGFRYKLFDKSLPGKPDLVFKARKKVIFVNGCFWHAHDCGKYVFPKTRLTFWIPKIAKNIERDQNVINKLNETGWKSLIIWECEIKDIEKISKRIIKFLGE